MTASNPVPVLERDPVCGMNVNPATTKHVYVHSGQTYYFCCARCVEKFAAEPSGYLNKPVSSGLVMLGMPATKPASSDTSVSLTKLQPALKPSPGGAAPAYVCPMCPKVREAKPGACPS